MPYWRLHYHLIWATLDRKPLLTDECEKIFYKILYEKAKELGLIVHAAGNVDDHVHIVVSIPPKLAIADCIRHIKGASAFAINQMHICNEQFKWQEGYGALSLGERSLQPAMKYAIQQKEHHQGQTTLSLYETIDE